jgi:uncharacterized protein YbcI
MTGTPATHPSPSLDGSKSAAISNLTVRLLSQYTGRGPTKARTYLQEDIITVVLRDTLTKAEVTLVNSDYGEMVLATRHTFQEVMGAELVGGVEEITERTVLAFLSANHIGPDIAVETFILVPQETAARPSPASETPTASASNGRESR